MGNDNRSVLSILSGGDNTFSMLVNDPERITGIDFTIEQLYLSMIKLEAIKHLDRNAMLGFLGIVADGNRIDKYRGFRETLTPECRSFWDNNLPAIDRGLVFIGRFDRYFSYFSKYIVPMLFSSRKIRKMLLPMKTVDRRAFYYNHWNSTQFRVVMKLFFSYFAMSRLGRERSFFTYAEGSVTEHIRKQVDYTLSGINAEKNPYLDYILNGNYKYTLPFYLRKSNYKRIRNNAGCISMHHMDISDIGNLGMKFNYYNLSDIFEYMDENTFNSIYGILLNNASQYARFVYWNMMVDRKLPEQYKAFVVQRKSIAHRYYLQNRAFFYRHLNVEDYQYEY